MLFSDPREVLLASGHQSASCAASVMHCGGNINKPFRGLVDQLVSATLAYSVLRTEAEYDAEE